MKLSEAIRLGSMLKPQAFGATTDGVGTCAFGAALEATGSDRALAEWCPVWRKVCPACNNTQRDLDNYKFNTIAHLNDTHRWTREQIADWVEQIEAQHEPQQVGKQNLTEALR